MSLPLWLIRSAHIELLGHLEPHEWIEMEMFSEFLRILFMIISQAFMGMFYYRKTEN